jgi:peroxiredoxin
MELPRFAAWQRTYGPEGLQVIAISMDDDPAPARAMARSLALDFPVVMGDPALGKRYGGVLGLPVTFLVARDGKIAARLEGESHLSEMETMIKQLLDRHRLAP